MKACAHCGAPCLQSHEWNGLSFCCHGCETVYRFLNDQGLQRYYELAEGERGIRVEVPEGGDELEVLQHPEVREKYIRYEDEEKTIYLLKIPAIHCRACVWLLEKLPTWCEGVMEARVNLDQGQLEVTATSEKQRLGEVVAMLRRLGYAPDLSFDMKSGGVSSSSRLHWLEIGVAGFCFGNVMLFSFPEYLSSSPLDEGFEHVFRWLNWLFSLPVMLFCARSILLSGFRSLLTRRPTVDLPIALGIAVLWGWSTWAVVVGAGGGYFDSLCGLVFFLLLGRSYQRKSFSHLVFERDEHRFFPLSVRLLREGKEVVQPLQSLGRGDRYLVRHGSLIPVQSVVHRGRAFLDYRMVTGETRSIEKKVGERIHPGGLQRGGEVELEAVEDLNESELVRLWNGKEEKPSKREALLDRFSAYFTVVILGLAVFAFVYHGMSAEALHRACAVLIVACPCALALSAPLTFGQAIRELSKRGFFVRHGASIETLAEIDHWIFDKTGTLTHIDDGGGEWTRPLTEPLRSAVSVLARQSNHPVASAMFNSLVQVEDRCETTEWLLEEGSFVEHPGQGMEGMIAGQRIRVGSRRWLTDEVESSAEEGAVWIEANGEIVGEFRPRLSLRQGVLEGLEKMGQRFDLSLISGDHDGDRHAFEAYFKAERMAFEQSPQDKANYVGKWVKKGRRVAMVGDGINDGPAMKTAHLGLAIPIDDGSFSPNSDVIVQESAVQHLFSFIQFCEFSTKNVGLCILISLIYNSIGISAAISGFLTPLWCAVLMPISSLSILFLSVGLTAAYATRFFKLIK